MKVRVPPKKPRQPESLFPSAGSHSILLSDAIAQTTAFRKITNGQPLLPGGTYQLANCFNRDIFDQVLQTTGCAGLRFYFGVKEPTGIYEGPHPPNVLTLVFCAIDSDGNDIINVQEAALKDELVMHALAAAPATPPPGTLLSGGENSVPCPGCCSKANVLNE